LNLQVTDQNGTKLTTGLNSDVLLVLSEAVLVINEVVIVIEKSTAQIDYEHDYDYAHDSQNSASYLSGIRDRSLVEHVHVLIDFFEQLAGKIENKKVFDQPVRCNEAALLLCHAAD